MSRINALFKRGPSRKNEEEDLFKWGKVPYKKDDMYFIKNLLNQSGSKKSSGKSFGAGYINCGYSSGGFSDSSKSTRQRVMFKMTHSYSRAAHQQYIYTYMPQKEKYGVEEKPILFGSDSIEYEKNMSDFHHKCIISPENQNVNLELLSTLFIEHLEKLTGYKLYWRGACHTDTEHNHAHICINGKDKNGKEVYFSPSLIKNTMRETLSYLTTQMVGRRTQEEISAARKNLTTAKRWTSLDEKLKSDKSKCRIDSFSNEVQARLLYLCEIGLAKRVSTVDFELDKNFEEVLKAQGRYNMYLQEYLTQGTPMKLYSGGSVQGKVKKVITFDKDESWNDAVIVDNGENRIFVPVYQLKKENLFGKTVVIDGGDRSLSRQVSDKNIRVLDRRDSIERE